MRGIYPNAGDLDIAVTEKGTEEDRNPKYDGWIFKFNPMFEDMRLYIKISSLIFRSFLFRREKND